MRALCIAVVLSLLFLMPLSADGCDAESSSLMLYAVYPTEGFEGFALFNHGQQTDLKDYSVTDGEGIVSFTSSLIIDAFSIVYFCKAEPPGWLGFDNVVVYGQNGVTMKGFALADNGDDIHLKKGNEIIDSFVYGDVTGTKDGWNGEAVQKIQKKHIAVRNSPFDTDSADDWTITIPGRSDFNSRTYEADVTPFSFPDDHSPFFRALQDPESRIDISVYLISHPRVVSSLLNSLSKGVSVRILIEGSPAGGTTSAEIKALKTLSEHGADVRVMKQTDGYRAYGYLHCKYAVIDGDTTIITSENWQKSSFESNRGWGAVIRSADYARYMTSVFESDFNRVHDVVSFNELYPTAESDSYGRYEVEEGYDILCHASVRAVVSPDNSYQMMRKLLSSAENRIYSEQLDVDYDWVNEDDNPISWMKDVPDTADCRLMVDVTFDDRNDSDYEDGYGIMDALEDSGIAVRTPEFSGMVHNKGVIVDDKVWVGSVNWTYNSFKENREAAVIIESKEISDYYAVLFLSDWGQSSGGEPSVECSITYQCRGNVFLFDAVGTDIDGCTFNWDLDGDGIYDKEGRKVISELPYGPSTVMLCIDSGGEQKIQSVTVSPHYDSGGFTVPMKYYPVIIICITVLLYGIIRWARYRNDPDKGLQGNRHRPRL